MNSNIHKQRTNTIQSQKWSSTKLRFSVTIGCHVELTFAIYYDGVHCAYHIRAFLVLCQLSLSHKLKFSRINVIHFSTHCSHSRMRRVIIKTTTALQITRLQNHCCLAINSYNLRLLLRPKHILTYWHFFATFLFQINFILDFHFTFTVYNYTYIIHFHIL